MAMTFDDDGFGDKMDSIVKDTQSEGMSEMVRETLEVAFKESQELVPRDTGNLADSGEIVDSIMSGLKAESGITYSAHYALIIEFSYISFLRVPMARAKIKAALTRVAGKKLSFIFKNNS